MKPLLVILGIWTLVLFAPSAAAGGEVGPCMDGTDNCMCGQGAVIPVTSCLVRWAGRAAECALFGGACPPPPL